MRLLNAAIGCQGGFGGWQLLCTAVAHLLLGRYAAFTRHEADMAEYTESGAHPKQDEQQQITGNRTRHTFHKDKNTGFYTKMTAVLPRGVSKVTVSDVITVKFV